MLIALFMPNLETAQLPRLPTFPRILFELRFTLAILLSFRDFIRNFTAMASHTLRYSSLHALVGRRSTIFPRRHGEYSDKDASLLRGIYYIRHAILHTTLQPGEEPSFLIFRPAMMQSQQRRRHFPSASHATTISRC